MMTMFNETLNYFYFAFSSLVHGVLKIVSFNDVLLLRSMQLTIGDKPSTVHLNIIKQAPQIIYFDPEYQCHILENFYFVFNLNRFCLIDEDMTPILPFNENNYVVHQNLISHTFWQKLWTIIVLFTDDAFDVTNDRVLALSADDGKDTFIIMILVAVLVSIGCFCISRFFDNEINDYNISCESEAESANELTALENDISLLREESHGILQLSLDPEPESFQKYQDFDISASNYDDGMVLDLISSVQEIFSPKTAQTAESFNRIPDESINIDQVVSYLSVSEDLSTSTNFENDINEKFLEQGFFLDESASIQPKKGCVTRLDQESWLPMEVPKTPPSKISTSFDIETASTYNNGNLIDLLELDQENDEIFTGGHRDPIGMSDNIYELKSGKVINSAQASLHFGSTAEILSAENDKFNSRPVTKEKDSKNSHVEQFIIRNRSRAQSVYSIESDVSDQVSHVSPLKFSASASSVKLNSIHDDIANNSIDIDESAEQRNIMDLNNMLDDITNKRPVTPMNDIFIEPERQIVEVYAQANHFDGNQGEQLEPVLKNNHKNQHLATFFKSPKKSILNIDQNLDDKENVFTGETTNIDPQSVPTTPKNKNNWKLDIFSNKFNHMRPLSISNEDLTNSGEVTTRKTTLGSASSSCGSPSKQSKLSKLSFSNLQKNVKNGGLTSSISPMRGSPFKVNDTIEISQLVKKYLLDDQNSNCDKYLIESYGNDEIDDAITQKNLEPILSLQLFDAISNSTLDAFIGSLFADFEGKESSSNWKPRSESIDRIRWLTISGADNEQANIQISRLITENVLLRIDDILKLPKTTRSQLSKKSILFIRDLVIYNNDRDLKYEVYTKLIRSLFPLTRSTNNKFIVNSSVKSICMMIGAINISDFIGSFKDNFQDSLTGKIGEEKYAILQSIKYFICQHKISLQKEISLVDELILKLLPFVNVLSSDANEKVRSEIVEIYMVLVEITENHNIDRLNDFYNSLSAQFQKRIDPPVSVDEP